MSLGGGQVAGVRGEWVATALGLRGRNGLQVPILVLHGESNRGQASPRTTTQRMCQQQEAVQTIRNHTILQRDTPAQKTK